jgi:hypothetical protein
LPKAGTSSLKRGYKKDFHIEVDDFLKVSGNLINTPYKKIKPKFVEIVSAQTQTKFTGAGKN